MNITTYIEGLAGEQSRPARERGELATAADLIRRQRKVLHALEFAGDLIEQQLLAVFIGQYELTDVFMHGLVLQDGRTVGEAFHESTGQILGQGTMQLGPGRGED